MRGSGEELVHQTTLHKADPDSPGEERTESERNGGKGN